MGVDVNLYNKRNARILHWEQKYGIQWTIGKIPLEKADVSENKRFASKRKKDDIKKTHQKQNNRIPCLLGHQML